MPTKGVNIMFQNHHRHLLVPFVIMLILKQSQKECKDANQTMVIYTLMLTKSILIAVTPTKLSAVTMADTQNQFKCIVEKMLSIHFYIITQVILAI